MVTAFLCELFKNRKVLKLRFHFLHQSTMKNEKALNCLSLLWIFIRALSPLKLTLFPYGLQYDISLIVFSTAFGMCVHLIAFSLSFSFHILGSIQESLEETTSTCFVFAS